MIQYVITRAPSDELEHFGIKGQKWGVRRYENADGTLTPEGRERYNVDNGGNRKYQRLLVKEVKQFKKLNDRTNIELQAQKSQQYQKRSEIAKKVGIASGAVGAAGLLNSGAVIPAIMRMGFKPKWSAEEIVNASKIGKVKMRGQNATYAARNESKIKKTTQPLRNVSIAVGVGGLLGGLITSKVYDSLSKAAKERTTELGHKKSIADAKNHVDRMMKTFADTPYEQLISRLYDVIGRT